MTGGGSVPYGLNMLGLMEETTGRDTDRAYEHQKIVLVELVVDPLAAGDLLGALAERLELDDGELEAAVAALERAGLAERDGPVVSATAAARYFEFLSPVML
jgi:hypothetical protein